MHKTKTTDIEVIESLEQSRSRADLRQKLLFLGPAFALLALLVGYPLINNFVMSLKDVPASLQGGEWVGIQNYLEIAKDQRFWLAAGRTFIYSFSAVFLEVILGVGMALILNQAFRGRSFLRALFLFPMIATPVAVSMVWRLMFQPELGVLNTLLMAAGLSPLQWLSNPTMAMVSLIIVDVWEWTPQVGLIVLSGLAGLSNEPQEAAIVDGANSWQRFWYVTLPAVRPVIVVAAITRLIEAMRTFDPIYVITGGGPGTATETLNLYAYQLMFQFLKPSYASAVALVFVVVMVLASFMILRLSRSSK
ncbi:MAG: sugar ABC transporter permease [Scrofimicrobium sp.]